MHGASNRICVLGAGVIGLSTGNVLRENGYRGRVKIVAERETPNTTSDVAAAFWYPFHAGDYDHAWATSTYFHFLSLIGNPEAGISEIQGKEFFNRDSDFSEWRRENWWTDIPSIRFGILPKEHVPDRFVAGVTFTVPVIHMPTYMGYLKKRFLDGGGVIENRFVDDVEYELNDCDYLINCTGLGSRELGGVQDTDVHPCRGQVVSVEPMDSIKELIFLTKGEEYEHEPLYIVPRQHHDIILGGTTDGEEEFDTTPKREVTERILARCAEMCPELRNAKIITSKTGLRPARRGKVRVGLDMSGKFAKPVLHNYGHGGAGVTLSWGCGQEMLRIIESQSPRVPSNA